jgi:hypothetical protein
MDLVLALTAWKASFGLIFIFFFVFPVLLHGLIGIAAGRTAIERRENREYLESGSDELRD